MRCGCHSCISVINQQSYYQQNTPLFSVNVTKNPAAVSNASNIFHVLLKYSFHLTRRYSVQLPARWSLLKMDRGLSHASRIRSELKETSSGGKKQTNKKKLSCMHSHSHTRFFFSLSRGDGGIEAPVSDWCAVAQVVFSWHRDCRGFWQCSL